jgi:hypothetical protein
VISALATYKSKDNAIYSKHLLLISIDSIFLKVLLNILVKYHSRAYFQPLMDFLAARQYSLNILFEIEEADKIIQNFKSRNSLIN